MRNAFLVLLYVSVENENTVRAVKQYSEHHIFSYAREYKKCKVIFQTSKQTILIESKQTTMFYKKVDLRTDLLEHRFKLCSVHVLMFSNGKIDRMSCPSRISNLFSEDIAKFWRGD